MTTVMFAGNVYFSLCDVIDCQIKLTFMIHAPILPPPTDYKLLKIVLDDSKDNLRIVGRDDVTTTPLTTLKRPAPQQLIAAMAFRLLGLDVPLLYNTGKLFTGQINNLAISNEAFKNDAGAISHTAHVLRVFVHNNDVAKHGQVQKNNVVDYTSELAEGMQDDDVISFSKILDSKEIVIVHNTSATEAKEKFILLNNNVNSTHKSLTAVLGYDTCGQVHLFHGKQDGADISYIKIYLKPLHTVILKNY
jgi:hypothetical protein